MPAPTAPSPLDPRQGDFEDDASSTKQQSLLAIAGTIFAEISLPKLLFAVLTLIVLPAIVFGLLPLLVSAWFDTAYRELRTWAGLSAVLLAIALIWLTTVGARSVRRVAETTFWSLNAIAIQPAYILFREGLRHLVERSFGRRASASERARLRALSAIGAGVLLFGVALSIAAYLWPSTRWNASAADLADPLRLIVPALANAVVLVTLYLAVASLVWGIADGTMDQPVDLEAFDALPAGARTWRVVHLSDVHVVAQRYGFRLESGRAGARGNDRFANTLACLTAIHAARPLDLVLISGDMTDAGLATEWAEFLDLMARHPALASRTLLVPGNHDVNIVDRVNPARLDLAFSPAKRLRQLRALSAMAALHGQRVRVVDPETGRLSRTLGEALEADGEAIATFADRGGLRASHRLQHLWNDLFPMVLLPDAPDGLGVMLLNSNAETHFSFTNALGMVARKEARALLAVADEHPGAHWIVMLHHHVVEYPKPVAKFSMRIGTALVNGSWFLRQLRPLARRMVVMHGHRHVDWTGRCGALRILSAPSPVMEPREKESTHFHIHTLAADPDGRLALLLPERVQIRQGFPAAGQAHLWQRAAWRARKTSMRRN